MINVKLMELKIKINLMGQKWSVKSVELIKIKMRHLRTYRPKKMIRNHQKLLRMRRNKTSMKVSREKFERKTKLEIEIYFITLTVSSACLMF